jgi:hypothetical protein
MPGAVLEAAIQLVCRSGEVILSKMETNPYPPQLPPAATEPRRYSRVSALVLSFFSPELYRDVARRWCGIGFWYLVLLLIISCLPLAIRAQIGYAKFVRQDAPRLLAGFPGITITNGVVSIDRPEPYIWRDPDNGKDVLLYVDTAGAFDLPEGAHAKAKLSRSQLVVEQNEYDKRTYDLSQVKSFFVDKTRVMGWFDTGIPLFGPLVFAAGLLGGLIWHLIQIVTYGVIGLLLASMLGARLEFPQLTRLAAVAITPAMLLDAAFDATGARVPHSWWLFLALELAYLAFAVKANVQPAPAPPGFPIYPPVQPPPQLPPRN